MGQNGRVDKTTHLAWLEQYAGRVDLMDQLSFNGSYSKHVKFEQLFPSDLLISCPSLHYRFSVARSRMV